MASKYAVLMEKSPIAAAPSTPLATISAPAARGCTLTSTPGTSAAPAKRRAATPDPKRVMYAPA